MKKTNKLNLIGSLAITAIAFISGCSKDDNPAPSLYTRLGGINSIAAVTDKFLTNVAADNAINARFEATVADEYRFRLLRDNLVDEICAGSGGPCQYKGKSMLEAHTGMNITTDEFNALVGDLVSALDYYKVSDKNKNDLLAILAPMQTDIVGH